MNRGHLAKLFLLDTVFSLTANHALAKRVGPWSIVECRVTAALASVLLAYTNCCSDATTPQRRE